MPQPIPAQNLLETDLDGHNAHPLTPSKEG